MPRPTHAPDADALARAQARQFRKLAENSLQGKLILRGGAALYANPMAAELLGAESADALLGMADLAPLVGELARERPQDLPNGGRRTRDLFRRRDGSNVAVELFVCAIDWFGAPALQCAFIDVTREEEAKAALAAANERYRLALSGGRMGVWDYDLTTQEAYLSGRARALLEADGLEPREALSAMFERVHPEDLDAVRAARARLQADGEALDIRYRLHTRAGDWVWLHVRGLATADGEGRVLRLTGSAEDVTHEQRMLEELRAAQAAAQAASEQKSVFLSTMSHEIRTPLNAILGVTSLLDTAGLDDDQRELLGLAERAGKHLLDLLNDVLDLSRIESGRLALALREAAPMEEVRLAVEACRARAEAKGLNLVCDLDSRPLRAKIDPLRLRQVVINLVDNAIKFTPAGSVRVRAAAAAHGERALLEVEVDDTGPGVPAEKLEAIFEPFTQAESGAARGHDGAGLGLTIARRIAQAMGGTLTAANRPAGGARFRLSAAIEPIAAAPDAHDAGLGLRILVAEDNPTNQKMMRLILTRLGCQVVIADDGAQAVAAFDAGAFDLVLMDLHMPVMDGIEAARRIRARPDRRASTPIIAVTADARLGVEERVLAAGMNAYLTKPLSIPRLVEEIARLTGAAAPAVRRA